MASYEVVLLKIGVPISAIPTIKREGKTVEEAVTERTSAALADISGSMVVEIYIPPREHREISKTNRQAPQKTIGRLPPKRSKR